MTEGRRAPSVTALLEQRKSSAERTRVRLLEALDRFEQGALVNLPPGSKLTVRNLAAEAKVSKDTPLSRYPKGHLNAGEYRFPEVVAKFNLLKEKLLDRPEVQNPKDRKISELRGVIKSLREQLVLAHRVNNQLDAELYEEKRHSRDLEEQLGKLRQGSLKVVQFRKKGSG